MPSSGVSEDNYSVLIYIKQTLKKNKKAESNKYCQGHMKPRTWPTKIHPVHLCVGVCLTDKAEQNKGLK